MPDTIFCLQDNILTGAQHLLRYAEGQTAAQNRVARLPSSNARRGIRTGALVAGSAGTVFAHALALPLDALTGEGPLLTPAWLRRHRTGVNTFILDNPHEHYGAPRGLLGPPTAFAVGFVGGLAKQVGWGAGVVVGLVLTFRLHLQGQSCTAWHQHMDDWGAHVGTKCRNTSIALASLCAAVAHDASRLPAVGLKITIPAVSVAFGCAVGAIGGLRDCYPHGIGEAVQHLGGAGERNTIACLVVLAVVLLLGASAGSIATTPCV